MLIEHTKYRPGDIVNFKLVSGDEIVGKLVQIGNASYELNRPCVVVTSPDGLGILQAMFGLDPDAENLTYRDQHIISMCRTHPKMEEHYVSVLHRDDEAHLDHSPQAPGGSSIAGV